MNENTEYRITSQKLTCTAWTGLGNPQGGLVFSNAFSGTFEQTHEWTSFIGASEFRPCSSTLRPYIIVIEAHMPVSI
jgi:hypothetical protein